MHLAEVVRDGEQSHGMTVVCQLARPAKTKAREPAVEQAHAQIGAFNVGCAD